MGAGGFVVLCVLLCVGLYFLNDDFRTAIKESYRSVRGLDTRARVHISGNFLNLRSGPSTDDEVLVQLPNGAELKVFFEDRSGQWIKVAHKDVVAYVHGYYLLFLDKRGAAIEHSWLFGTWDNSDKKYTFNVRDNRLVMGGIVLVKGDGTEYEYVNVTVR